MLVTPPNRARGCPVRASSILVPGVDRARRASASRGGLTGRLGGSCIPELAREPRKRPHRLKGSAGLAKCPKALRSHTEEPLGTAAPSGVASPRREVTEPVDSRAAERRIHSRDRYAATGLLTENASDVHPVGVVGVQGEKRQEHELLERRQLISTSHRSAGACLSRECGGAGPVSASPGMPPAAAPTFPGTSAGPPPRRDRRWPRASRSCTWRLPH